MGLGLVLEKIIFIASAVMGLCLGGLAAYRVDIIYRLNKDVKLCDFENVTEDAGCKNWGTYVAGTSIALLVGVVQCLCGCISLCHKGPDKAAAGSHFGYAILLVVAAGCLLWAKKQLTEDTRSLLEFAKNESASHLSKDQVNNIEKLSDSDREEALFWSLVGFILIDAVFSLIAAFVILIIGE